MSLSQKQKNVHKSGHLSDNGQMVKNVTFLLLVIYDFGMIIACYNYISGCELKTDRNIFEYENFQM